MTVPRVIVRAKRATPFYARHPWVFTGAIERVEGQPADGAEIDLLTHDQQFIARGIYNSHSKIRVRLYSWQAESQIDRDFFRTRFEHAIQLRYQTLGLSDPAGGCRLISSEADGVSGLIVDRYGSFLSLQFTALGMAQRQDVIVEVLRELLQPAGIYGRTERGVGQLEGLELQDGPLWGEPPPSDLTILENGLRFRVNLPEGQKTGTYLDQRDNRRAVGDYCRNRSVLDAFCYAGGFALNALKAGAISVEGVDASEGALALASENARLNGYENVTFTKADVFVYLDQLAQLGRKFGVVILDPPKFARSNSAIEEALRGYRRLQGLGLRLLEPNGVLVTCCCSGLITPDMLKQVLGQVSVAERRVVQLLEVRGAAPDHPVAVSCPESSYLKCLIARVE